MAFIFRVILILTARFLSVIEGAPVLSVDDTPSNYSSVATLKCSDPTYTSGNGYRWTKDGVLIFDQSGEVSTSGKYSEGIDGTTFKLIISNLVADDEGSYICNHGFVDSSTLNLEIESRGEVKAEQLSNGKLEVIFSKIYPSTITTVITCGMK
ncbi:uncharacterized protein LOC128554183, partial [Mercenaria mercenaria]|uniref:uncharacterized protein LOC128554183 n=1 Tax=Mercenaria mercenaria TaxID=6596 RepID=UPI00234F4521